MRTMPVELERFRHLVRRDSATETPTHFQTPVDLGHGETLLFSCLKELPVEGPEQPFNPFTSAADIYGVLSRSFGGEYEQLILSVMLGNFIPATETEPPQFVIAMNGDVMTQPQALVLVEWPLGNPPQDVNLDSDFAAKHGAVYYHRVDHTDPNADFSSAHGTDVWVLSAEGLGDFRQEVQRSWNAREAGAETVFRRYAMELPYYRERVREYDHRVNQILRWRLAYGEDRADLTVFPGDEDEHTTPILYNESGLKLLRDAVDGGLRARALGSFLDIFAR